MECRGRGECLKQCVCFCDADGNTNTCSCGHSAHVKLSGGDTYTSKYCKMPCKHECILAPCNNFTICKQKRPQMLLDCNNGMCLDCSIEYRKLRFERRGDCPVCLEPKNLVEVVCGKHTICLDCLKRWAEYTKLPTTCPICSQTVPK